MSRIQFDNEKEGERGMVTVILRKGIFRIPLTTLRYLQKEGRKLRLVHEGGTVDHYGKMEEVEGRLPPCFFRCHYSTVVNFHYVQSLKENFFYLVTGEILAVSQRKRGDARRAFLHFLQEEEKR